jgi:hypothetical protein
MKPSKTLEEIMIEKEELRQLKLDDDEKKYKEKYIEDLKEEIYRVKDIINKKGYDNLTAFNQIVREYRTSLKKHLSILISDLND